MLASEQPSTCVMELRTAQSDWHAVASSVPSALAAPTRLELRTVLTFVACHPAVWWLKMGTQGSMAGSTNTCDEGRTPQPARDSAHGSHTATLNVK
jgi:hypothetical protein